MRAGTNRHQILTKLCEPEIYNSALVQSWIKEHSNGPTLPDLIQKYTLTEKKGYLGALHEISGKASSHNKKVTEKQDDEKTIVSEKYIKLAKEVSSLEKHIDWENKLLYTIVK